jgi:hypothetical protein
MQEILGSLVKPRLALVAEVERDDGQRHAPRGAPVGETMGRMRQKNAMIPVDFVLSGL